MSIWSQELGVGSREFGVKNLELENCMPSGIWNWVTTAWVGNLETAARACMTACLHVEAETANNGWQPSS